MSDIKPIETVYNGYRFRSRLEARWAVFFDAAKIKYEYEPEGFELPDGTKYLPDFYLPWFNCYVEIKPNSETEIEKATAIAKKISTEKALLLCVGLPSDDNITLYDGINHWKAAFYQGIAWESDIGGRSCCIFEETHRHISLVCETNCKPVFLYALAEGTTDRFQDIDVRIGDYRDRFEWAKEKAKQARFEHGECG